MIQESSSCIEDNETYLNRHSCHVWGSENPHDGVENEHGSPKVKV
jgi:hypothetical protein